MQWLRHKRTSESRSSQHALRPFSLKEKRCDRCVVTPSRCCFDHRAAILKLVLNSRPAPAALTQAFRTELRSATIDGLQLFRCS